jgi:hypothetical protein
MEVIKNFPEDHVRKLQLNQETWEQRGWGDINNYMYELNTHTHSIIVFNTIVFLRIILNLTCIDFLRGCLSS